jgi:CRP-like cAMP-binding protein
MKDALKILGKVVHQLQKERGCTALFLGSNGEIFTDELSKQINQSNLVLTELDESFQSWQKSKKLPEPAVTKINTVINNISNLEEFRKKIKNLNISLSAAINNLTHQFISPSIDLMSEIALFDKDTDATKVSAYSSFLNWKERSGRERAIGMRGFVLGTFNNEEFLERMKFIISEQDRYEQTFLSLANEEQKKHLEKVMQSSSLARVDKIHDAVEKKPNAKLLSTMTAEAWYELMTKKIDLMHKVEILLTNTLYQTTNISTENIHTLPKATISEKHKEFIDNLPLFSGLSTETIAKLVQHAQVREYKKGKLLFLEGEQSTRLYIILKGWVKLFKGTASGDEAILQMLSSGDTVVESSIFLNTPFPVSAQIIEDAVLLSLPAPTIREYINEHNVLALNLLTNMSERSQTVIHQIESSRLKSATERVGWFLLKLMVEKKWILDAVELPYNKSTIASYLDMKPETFSRTLKQFKKWGVKIENDLIIFPDRKRLCNYCDSSTAMGCSLHNSNECPNPQFIEEISEGLT